MALRAAAVVAGDMVAGSVGLEMVAEMGWLESDGSVSLGGSCCLGCD